MAGLSSSSWDFRYIHIYERQCRWIGEAVGCIGNIPRLSRHKNRIGKGVNPQRKAYQHALLLQPALRDFRWVLFADADEFLILDCAGSVTLPSFLRALAAHFPNGHPAAVLFPWHWRHTDLAFSRPATFMLDAYPHATFHRNVKSIVKISQALGMSQVHVPTISEEAFVVDPDCHIVPLERVWDGITVNLRPRASNTFGRRAL